MKRNLIIALGFAWLALFPFTRLEAQKMSMAETRVRQCLRDYQNLSSLGSAGSAYIDSLHIEAFKNLFDEEAYLFWDLFIVDSLQLDLSKLNARGRIPYQLSPFDYIENIKTLYNGLKPVATCDRITVKMSDDGLSAVAYLRKTNHPQKSMTGAREKAPAIQVNLKITFLIKGDIVKIGNINEDTRLTRIKSAYVEAGIGLLNSLSGFIFTSPSSSLGPSFARNYTLDNNPAYLLGAGMDIRLNLKEARGLVIQTGLQATFSKVTAEVTGYGYSYQKLYDPGSRPFTYTVIDSAKTVKETSRFTTLSLPIAAKYYLNNRLYVKSGIQFNLVHVTSEADFLFQQKVAGMIRKNDNEWFYIDPSSPADRDLLEMFGLIGEGDPLVNAKKIEPGIAGNAFSFSLILGAGYEVRIGKVFIGLEPFINLGLTSSVAGAGKEEYVINPKEKTNSFLTTYSSPRFNSAGVKIVIGKLFYR